MITNRLISAVIDQSNSPVNCDQSRCLRMRFSESCCHKCLSVCHSGAINLEDGLQLDSDLCTGCLACTTVCPTGALEPDTPFSPLLNRLSQYRNETFVLGCSRNQESPANFRLPCLGLLSLEHLLALFKTSKASLQFDLTGCADCNAKGMLPTLQEHFSKALELEPPESAASLIEDRQLLQHQPETMDRRSFFNSFKTFAAKGAEVVLAEDPPKKQLAYADKYIPRRRELLLNISNRLSPQTVKSLNYSLNISDSCTGCQGCIRICPTGALTSSETNTGQPATPELLKDSCTGCGLCVEFCLEHSISIAPKKTTGLS